MNIQLTKHPERKYGMGISMNVGIPPEPPTPYLVVMDEHSAVTRYTYEDNRIPEAAFSGNTDIFYVRVSSGMSFGGHSTFRGCTNLKMAVLTGGGTIVAHTFQDCTSLKEVVFNPQVTSRLEGWVFSGCTSLSSITIPDSVTLIGGYSFQGCTSLDNVTLGSGLTQINLQCFEGCISLTSITCRATTAPTLGANVFRNVAEYGNLFVPMGATGYDAWLSLLPEGWIIDEYAPAEEENDEEPEP